MNEKRLSECLYNLMLDIARLIPWESKTQFYDYLKSEIGFSEEEINIFLSAFPNIDGEIAVQG